MAAPPKNYRQYKQKAFGPWILDLKNPEGGQAGPELWKLYSETNNKHQNTITVSESGMMRVSNDGAIEIHAGDRNTPNSFDIRVDAAKGQISITAATTVKIKGSTVMVEALEDIDLVAGQSVNIKSGSGRILLDGNVIDKKTITGSILPPDKLWTNRILANAPVGFGTLFKIGLGFLTGGLGGALLGGLGVGGLGGLGGSSLLGGLTGDLFGGALGEGLSGALGGGLGGILGEGLSGALGGGLGGILGEGLTGALGGSLVGDLFGGALGEGLSGALGGSLGGVFGDLPGGLLTGAINGLGNGDVFGGLIQGGLNGLGLTDGSLMGNLIGGFTEGLGINQLLEGVGLEAVSALFGGVGGSDAFGGIINSLATGQGLSVADIGGSIVQVAFGDSGIFGGDSGGLFTSAVGEIGKNIFGSVQQNPSNLPDFSKVGDFTGTFDVYTA